MAKEVAAKERAPRVPYLQYGGKTKIAKWIVGFFPDHKIYAEPFCGSCAVLFAKPRSFIEIVNDLDGRIINMFEQLRANPKLLASVLWATPYSKENWRDVPAEPDALEDARLLMAQGSQFFCGGKGSTWCARASTGKGKPQSSVWADNFLRVIPAAARLRQAIVMNDDANAVIERVYQNSDALIYADPPYLGHENEYRFQVQYEKMAELLRAAQAKVVVSEYPAADEFFRGWHRVERECNGVTRKGAGRKKTEVLYMNFEPEVAIAA